MNLLDFIDIHINAEFLFFLARNIFSCFQVLYKILKFYVFKDIISHMFAKMEQTKLDSCF